MNARLGCPTVLHLERSDHGFGAELSNHITDRSLAGLIASDQVQGQPPLNAGYSAVDVLVSLQGTNPKQDQGCYQLISHWRGGQHLGRCRKTMQVRLGASKSRTFGMIRVQACMWVDG